MGSVVEKPSVHNQIAAAIGRTLSARPFGDTTLISLPIMYPSGAFAGVHVTLTGDECYVSDAAIGLREAEMAGASDFFDSSARSAADWFGVGYDGASVFVASAPLSRIEGAIVAVANASARAVAHALLSSAERRDRNRNSDLFDRLREFFGINRVARSENVAGKDAEWNAHNVVSINGKKSIFEYVSTNTNSIASKFLMFSDLRNTGKPISLNSVVDAVDKLPAKGSMLSDVSNIVAIGSTRERFAQYAEAV